MSVPSVHIVILNWNGLADTRECLASLGEQSYPSLRIHVVDNGSAHDEAATIEREFPRVNVLRQERNLGFCEGNNVGIRRALEKGADYVLILNNDTLVPSNLIRTLIDESAPLEAVGAVSPVILYHPQRETVWFAGAVWDGLTAGFRHVLAGRPRAELREQEPYRSAYACGCCLLVHASVLRRIGLMDARYFAYYDEADWCSRMKEAGLECYVIPRAVLYHKVSGSTPSIISTYLMARNRLLWMKEHLKARERLKSYPYLLKETLWNFCNLGGIRRRKHSLSVEQSKAMLLASRDFLRGKFGAWPKRVEQLRRGHDGNS
jgi:GT2 family glycosyltransferase